jgi:hypothetical protein
MVTHTYIGELQNVLDQALTNGDDMINALQHLIFDLLTTSTFKVDAQQKILATVQEQCKRLAPRPKK